jgi:regulator of PEP synthase PpsR (kinase-PPPase family)
MSGVKVFVVSDSLGFMAPESVIHLAASYFEGSDIDIVKFPNVKTAQKALEIIKLAKENRPSLIVFSTILTEVRDFLVLKSIEFNIEYVDALSPAVKAVGAMMTREFHLVKAYSKQAQFSTFPLSR